MIPSVSLVDLTGFKACPGSSAPTNSNVHWLGKLPLALTLLGFGQRTGSAVVPAKKNVPDWALSAIDGARNPLPHVPRRATMSIGLYLKLSLGGVEPPTPLL